MCCACMRGQQGCLTRHLFYLLHDLQVPYHKLALAAMYHQVLKASSCAGSRSIRTWLSSGSTLQVSSPLSHRIRMHFLMCLDKRLRLSLLVLGVLRLRLWQLLADKSSPFQMVQALSSHLQEVPAEDVLLSLHHVPQVCTLTS